MYTEALLTALLRARNLTTTRCKRFIFAVFSNPHTCSTCFCTMKKSFLYAVMPLLNWRLSAAVQLSDPEGVK